MINWKFNSIMIDPLPTSNNLLLDSGGIKRQRGRFTGLQVYRFFIFEKYFQKEEGDGFFIEILLNDCWFLRLNLIYYKYIENEFE